MYLECDLVINSCKLKEKIIPAFEEAHGAEYQALFFIDNSQGHSAYAEDTVKTGSSRSGTDERGKCDNVGLSAACPSNEATIHSVVVAVA